MKREALVVILTVAVTVVFSAVLASLLLETEITEKKVFQRNDLLIFKNTTEEKIQRFAKEYNLTLISVKKNKKNIAVQFEKKVMAVYNPFRGSGLVIFKEKEIIVEAEEPMKIVAEEIARGRWYEIKELQVKQGIIFPKAVIIKKK